MNQIFSIILVIAMAFSSIGGLTAQTEGPVSFETKISVDADALLGLTGTAGTEVPAETKQTMQVIGDILSALTLKGVADNGAAELVLLAGNDAALSIGGKTEEKGVTVASRLGSKVVFVSNEMVEMMKKQMTSSMTPQAAGLDTSALEKLQNVDMEQVTKDAEEALEKLSQAFEAKKGQTESGAFTVDDMEFTGKTPVDITYAEAVELFLNTAKEMIAKDSIKPLAEAAGTDFGAEIDKALEELKKQPETDYPDMTLTIYTNTANEAYYVCDMTREAKAEGTAAEKLYMGYGKMEGMNRMTAKMDTNGSKAIVKAISTPDGSLNLAATIESEQANAEIAAAQTGDGTMEMLCRIKASGTDARIDVHSEKTEDERSNFSLNVYLGESEKPLISFTGSAGKGGEMVSVFEGENVTAIPYEKLMDTQDTTAANQVQIQLMAGLMKSITVITKNVSEDTAVWIQTQIGQMMNPKTAQPQGEPVVDGE